MGSPPRLWDTSAAPAVASANDGSAVELGVRFIPERAGSISGIVLQGRGQLGGARRTHLDHCRAAARSASFANETATGWQQVLFATPVTVEGGLAYIASYHAPVGRYSVTAGAFNGAGVNRPPLHAPASAAGAGNGLYSYGPGGFPSQSSNGNNYWVDVIYEDTSAPRVTTTAPSAGQASVPATTTVNATFDEAVQPGSVAMELRDDGGGLTAGAQTYDAPSRTASYSPNAPLAAGRTYTAAVTAATDLQGNGMTAPAVWSFTTVSANSISIFGPTAQPAVPAAKDPGAVELGAKFRSDVAGQIAGVRFYKGAGNTGLHTGRLWSQSGTFLASVQFQNETASGWQFASFATPVPINAGTVYVVSYHAPVGRYAVTSAGFAAADIVNGPLRALRDGTAGGNGLYRYGAGGVMPTSSWNGNNYWVDVLFQPGG